MLIAGASRHAKEILDILLSLNETGDIVFFDDVSSSNTSIKNTFLGFKLISTLKEAKIHLKHDHRFILALGGPHKRLHVYKKILSLNGNAYSLIAPSAIIGHYAVNLGDGINIMHNVFISSDVQIGKGTLINTFSSIHHDVIIGDFCELSPRSTLLGGCRIGKFTTIGSAATILPDVIIGQNVTIGAGTVVTKKIPDNSMVVGVPGRIIKKLTP